MGDNIDNSEKTASQIKEDLFKLLPLIPVFMTVLGSVKIHYYYRPYKINIFNYLDLQDILLIFLNDFYSVVVSLGFLAIINFISFEQNLLSYEFPIPVWWGNLPIYVQGIALVIYRTVTSTIVIIFLCIWFIQYVDIYRYPILIGGVASLIASIFRNRIYEFFATQLNSTMAYLYTLYVSFFLILMLITFLADINDRYKQSAGFSDKGYLKIENEIINFDVNKQLLGRTKSYSFVFTPADSCVRIINNSDIKEFFIKIDH